MNHKVGKEISHEKICDDTNACPVCSGRFDSLSPLQKKSALANMKHSPYLRQYEQPKYSPQKSTPLTPSQIEEIKYKYQHPGSIRLNKPKLIKVGKLDWDEFATNEDFNRIDELVKHHNKMNHPQPMLIDVGEQGEDNDMSDTEDVASILLSLAKNDKK